MARMRIRPWIPTGYLVSAARTPRSSRGDPALRGAGHGLRRNRERAERSVELVRVELGARRVPELRGELEVAVLRPVGQEPKELVEVLMGIDSVQATRSDDREDRGGALGMGVAAVEHPIFSTDDHFSKRAF